MLRKLFSCLTLPLLLLLSNSSGNSAPQLPGKNPDGQTGTLERLIVANGNAVMDLDLNRLRGDGSAAPQSKREGVRFDVGPNSFFTILVFNDVLRGPEQGSMGLVWGNSRNLPEPLNASSNQLVIEKLAADESSDLVVRDGKTGFVFFNVEGNLYKYDAAAHLLTINRGRLLISEELAKMLGRPADAGAAVGEISITTSMYPIETTAVVNGAAQSAIMPARPGGGPEDPNFVPGPDVIVGDLPSMAQFGATGTQVGLAVGTTSCNNGTVELNWFALPNIDHPVIPQNFYRMSGGATNDDRFEQVGQSWLKHAFTALQGNACGFGCTPAGSGTHLGVGCSDPYGSGLNAGQSGLGSRAWVNPFTGAYPSTANNHSGHGDSDAAATHRILVESSDLNTVLNPGATYYAEAQYVTPHEYAWCQSHAGQCNMYNNASYRRFTVTGTTGFSFSPVGSTIRMTPAVNAWTGATINTIEPEPGVDGRAFIAYKVTGPVAGVWHYEYAINNQNLDRAIQSFSIPLGCAVTLNNIGFHAPPNHPGIANDGTQGSAGYGNATWTSNQTASAVSWNTETFAQNQNANAIRWGTLYNFRFDTNHAPVFTEATIGFLKTGAPITVSILGPNACDVAPSPTPTATATPIPVTPTPTPPATPTPSLTPGVTPSPTCGTATFSNPAIITIPDSGAGAPYPSNISVAGVGGTITKVTVKLNNLSHTFPSDIDILLVGPGGQNAIIMSDVGGGDDVSGIDLTLDDAAVSNLPDSLLTTGTFKPTNLDPGDTWPAPAPAPAGGSAFSVFNGATPNGTWSLYVLDDADIDLGSIAGGWQLSINTTGACGTPVPSPTSDPFPPTPTPSPSPTTPTPTPPAPTPTTTPPSSTPTPTTTPIPAPTPTPTPAAQSLNLSTRMRVQTGEGVGIGGFIITGSAPKHILLRAIGPSLAQSGIPNVLADPVIELHGLGSFVTVTNDNWRDDPVQQAAIIATGIPPSNNLEAAIDTTLLPGAYTAIVSGKNNTSGVALVEVYDLSPAVLAKLANISTRAFVGTGSEIVIAGFILGGNNSGDDEVVVRGLGGAGVPNPLLDPTLELRDANGALIGSDNDWQDDAGQAAGLSSIGLAPPHTLDAAIMATLPPGLYTALLAGRNNSTGIGLVEVYDLGL